MKRIPTIVLSVLLAAAVISGLVLYEKYQNTKDALASKEKTLISLDEKTHQLRQELSSIRDANQERAENNLKELGRAKGQISELLSQLKSAGSHIKTLTGEIEKKDATIGELQRSLSDVEKDRDGIEDRLFRLQSSHKATVSDFEKKIQARNVRIAELQLQLQNAAEQAFILEEAVGAHLGKLEELQGQISSLEKQKKDVDVQLTKLKADYETAVSEFNRQNADWGAMISDLRKRSEDILSQMPFLQEEVAKERKETKVIELSLSDLENRRDAAEALLEQLKSAHTVTVSYLQEEIKLRDTAVEALARQLRSARSEVLKLRENLERHQTEMNALRGQLTAIEEQKRAAGLQLERLKSAHETTVNDLAKQIKDRDNRVAELEGELGDAKTQAASLRQEIAKDRKEVETLQKDIESFEEQPAVSEPQGEQPKSGQEVMVFQPDSGIQDRDAAIRILRKKVEELDSQRLLHEEVIAKGESKMEELQGLLTEAREQQYTAEAQLERLRSVHEATVIDLTKQIKDRDNRVAQLEDRLGDVKTRMRSLQQEIATAQEGVEVRQQRIERLEEQKAALDIQVAQLKSVHEAAVSGLHTQIQDRDAAMRDLRQKVEDLAAQLSSQEKHLAKCQSEMQALQSKLSDLLGQRAQLVTQIDELKSTYDSVVSDLKGEIQNKQVTLHELEEKLSITFVDRILFEFGRADITPKGKELLKRVGKALKNVGAKQIRVVGHTDNKLILPEHRYKFPSNWELSAARAAAVVRYFQNDIGIDPRNLEAVGQSFYRPVASNETEEGRSQNRRVAIIIAPKLE